MSTSNFNLRGIAPEVMSLLKREAKEQHVSINLLILKLIEQGIGYTRKGKRTSYHELDALAGSWSAADSKEFEENIQCFERVHMTGISRKLRDCLSEAR